MTLEDKYQLAFNIIKRAGVQDNQDAVISISECIGEDRYFYELSEGEMVIFLTWEDNLIDGNRYIFINNLWIEPHYRSSNTLVRVRTALKYLLGDVYKFYWHDKKKDKLVHRS